MRFKRDHFLENNFLICHHQFLESDSNAFQFCPLPNNIKLSIEYLTLGERNDLNIF